MGTLRYEVTPVAKPRQTRRDVWAKRPCVLRYRAFADALRALGATLEDGDELTFRIAMPPSWSRAKRALHDGSAHRQTPDLDNLLKAYSDAVLLDDSRISWLGPMRKVWAQVAAIEVTRKNLTDQA